MVKSSKSDNIRIMITFGLVIFYITGCERLPVESPGSDLFPPAIPTGLRVYYAADGEVGIVWSPNTEPDINRYYIYRMADTTSGSYLLLGYTTDNYFINDSLDYNTSYFYRVSAADRSGNESLASDSVRAEPKNIYPPLKPRNFEVLGRNYENELSVLLSWSPPYETDISGYNIYRGTSPDMATDSSHFINFTAATRYTDLISLSTGIPYYYKIIAVDKGGLTSPPSNINSDIILPLPEIVYPSEGALVNRFNLVSVTGIPFACNYKLLLQHNSTSGELWNITVNHSGLADTVAIPFQSYYLSANRDYFIRIETYYKSESYPNGVSFSRRFSIRS